MPRHHQMIVDVHHAGRNIQVLTSGNGIYKCLLDGLSLHGEEVSAAAAMRWLGGMLEDNSGDK